MDAGIAIRNQIKEPIQPASFLLGDIGDIGNIGTVCLLKGRYFGVVCMD